MRPEAQLWWDQAQADLDSAEAILDVGKYYVSVFLAQQAVEKGLKALYLERVHEMPPRTHNINRMAAELDVPEKYLDGIRNLSTEYITTRYPDAAYGLPAEIYDEDIASDHVRLAKEVITWIKNRLTT